MMEWISGLASLSTVWDKLRAIFHGRRANSTLPPQTAASRAHVEQRSTGQGNVNANAERDLNLSANVINVITNASERNVIASLEHALPSSLEKVDEEFRYHWLDHSRSATTDRARKQFGALLDKESVSPDSVSPRTMRLLSEMSSREAKEFLAYCNQAVEGVFFGSDVEGNTRKSGTVLLHTTRNEGLLAGIGLLREMSTRDGRVDSDFILNQDQLKSFRKIGASEFSFNFGVTYFGHMARVLSVDRIPVSKWWFTDEGQQLFETIEKSEISGYWDRVIESLSARGYTVVPSSPAGDKK